MAPTPYPRTTLKRTLKAHSNRPVSKNVDILVYLDYVLFMQELMRAASVRAREEGRKGGNVTAADVGRVTEVRQKPATGWWRDRGPRGGRVILEGQESKSEC